MAEEEIKSIPVIAAEVAAPVEVPVGVSRGKEFDREGWEPRTALGKLVKEGKITSINQILDNGMTILESGIVDFLIPNMQSDVLSIGQSKGKFGGGKRTIWRTTQKKTPEGNSPSFASLIVTGNNNGYVGLGYGKARETLPSREKAVKAAKLNVIKIVRGCGSWLCFCSQHHSIPYKITGKCGSVEMELIPAPKGTGLCVEKECSKILRLAGIKDVYSHTEGSTTTKLNMLMACFNALKNLSQMKVREEIKKPLGVLRGAA